MNKACAHFFSIAEAIQRLLHPYAEVLIHDIQENKIVAIYNSFSKRKVGDPSLLIQEDIQSLHDSIGPYEKTNWNGNKLKSVSSVIRNEQGQAVGLLCINLDVSIIHQVQNSLLQFLSCAQLGTKPEPLFKDDWQERINTYVHHYLNERQLSLISLTKKEKKDLIDHLHTIGAFSGKNSAQYIAKILNVSRATIYNYLER